MAFCARFLNKNRMDNFILQTDRNGILSITIEIASEKHNLHVFQNDTPYSIAYRFCIENSWDLTCVQIVSDKIKSVFESYIQNPSLDPKLRMKLQQLLPQRNVNDLQNLQHKFDNIIILPENTIITPQNILQDEKNHTFNFEKVQKQDSRVNESISSQRLQINPKNIQTNLQNSAVISNSCLQSATNSNSKYKYFCYSKEISSRMEQIKTNQLSQSFDATQKNNKKKRNHISITVNQNDSTSGRKHYAQNGMQYNSNDKSLNCLMNSNSGSCMDTAKNKLSILNHNSIKLNQNSRRSENSNERFGEKNYNSKSNNYLGEDVSKSGSFYCQDGIESEKRFQRNKSCIEYGKHINSDSIFCKSKHGLQPIKQDRFSLYENDNNYMDGYCTQNGGSQSLYKSLLSKYDSRNSEEEFAVKYVRENRVKTLESRSLSPIRVYERGVSYLGLKETKMEQLRQTLVENEMSSCTFFPHTNNRANQQLLPKREKSTYDLLYENRIDLQKKKELIKDRIQKEETKNYSYRPALNPTSQHLMKARNQLLPDTLANYSTQRNVNLSLIQQEMLKECTFQPTINKNSSRIIQNVQQPLSVYQRLYPKKEMSQTQNIPNSHSLLPQQIEFSLSNANQQSPLEGSPSPIENSENCIIFSNKRESMHDQREHSQFTTKECDENRSPDSQKNSPYQGQMKQSACFRQAEADNNISCRESSFSQVKRLREQSKNSISPNKNSIAMIERRKRERLEDIFLVMDSDHDGYISAQNIDIHSLPEEFLLLISPLLYELEELQVQLNLSQFIEAGEKLYKQLPLQQKNKLLLFDIYQKWNREKEMLSTEGLVFQPKINPISQHIDEQLCPDRHCVSNLYDLYKSRDRLAQEKLTQKRRDKETSISANCTFRPNIAALTPTKQTYFQSSQNKSFNNFFIKQASQL